MPELSEEEYDALDELWTNNPPEITGDGGNGFFMEHKNEIVILDERFIGTVVCSPPIIHRTNLEQLVLATDSPTFLPMTRDGVPEEIEIPPALLGEMSGEMAGKIFELIDRDGEITIPNLAERLGVTTRTVERHIAA